MISFHFLIFFVFSITTVYEVSSPSPHVQHPWYNSSIRTISQSTHSSTSDHAIAYSQVIWCWEHQGEPQGIKKRPLNLKTTKVT